MTARLAGRTVIVTGATSGIGRAIAERCLAEGARVVASGRRLDALATLAGDADHLVTVAADLVDEGAPEQLVAAAQERFGGLDGLVHAAGTVRRNEDPTAPADVDAFRRLVDENLTATYRLACAAMVPLAAQGRGSIVLLSSQLAHIGLPGYASYSAAKGGVRGLVRALAIDGGPRGVRVNGLAPGVVQTPMAYIGRDGFDAAIPAIAERHPLRRIGQPEDMGGPAVFLLSDDSAWMTAQELVVDGGFTAT